MTIMNLNIIPDLQLFLLYTFYHMILYCVHHLQNVDNTDGLFENLESIIPSLFDALYMIAIKVCDLEKIALETLVVLIKVIGSLLMGLWCLLMALLKFWMF